MYEYIQSRYDQYHRQFGILQNEHKDILSINTQGLFIFIQSNFSVDIYGFSKLYFKIHF